MPGSWMTERDLTTLESLHASLGTRLSKYHKPELREAEEELVDFFKRWFYYCNNVMAANVAGNEPFYDWEDQVYFDLMGNISRGEGFKEHFGAIGPYMNNANIAFKELEITATAPDAVHTTQLQRFKGVAKDGRAFDFTYRLTQILRKTEDGWKIVHEHLSFPVDMQTGRANFTDSNWDMREAYNLSKGKQNL
ncbi:hypothetical protein B0J12DRAFT_784551 [Macrophomina phaseolina]|uniref:SnoaL-like domain-containing protein n=1 Tax=Macrophomina phaseolina TaxID=35725 RepID=A0ABQ8GFY8_9PEZI|nr:hypothetical protein B0J12DRAFT_784551 [Macrophomina phaseolina]